MPLTRTEYESILKIDYSPAIVDQLENSTALLSRIEKRPSETGGKHMYIPLRTGRTSSIGARTDGADETTPKGATPVYSQATFPVKSLYASMRITGLSMRLSRSNAYAFAKSNLQDMKDTVTDFMKDVNRQLFGDGSSDLAKLTTAASGSVTTTFTVASNLYPLRPSRYLNVNQVVDVIERTSGTKIVDSCLLSSINSSTQVELKTAAGAAVSISFGPNSVYSIVREDNYGTSSTGKSKEIYGLTAVINAANPDSIFSADAYLIDDFGGIDRAAAANASWKSVERGNSGTLRPASVNLLEEAIDAIQSEGGGGEVSLIQTNLHIKRIFGNIFAAARVYDKEMELPGGWKAISINGIPMVADVDAPDYQIFLVDESTLIFGVTGNWEWIENDSGGILHKLVQQDQFEATMVRDCNLMCNKPNANCRVYDIAHS